MSIALKVRRNSLFSLLSIFSRLFAVVVVFWGIARTYGPEVFGQFTLAHTIATILIVFADFGFDILLTTEVARNIKNASQIFRQFFSYKLVFTTAAVLFMWIIALFLDVNNDTRILILILSFFTAFTTLNNFLYALFRGFEELQYETKVSFVNNFTLLVVTLLLVYYKVDVIYLAIAFVGSRVLGFLQAVKYSFKLLPNINYRLNFSGAKEVKSKIFVFGFNLVFNYLFFQLDTILLAIIKNEYSVGIYQSVIKLIMLPLIIPDILINTLTPLLSRLNVENKTNWENVGRLMNKLLVFVGAPISITLFVFAEQIISFVYGLSSYSEAVPVLRIFALTIFIRFSLEAFALMLTTSNRQIIRMKVVIIATFLNLLLNFYFIPRFGAYGAALVSLVTNIFVGFAYYIKTFPFVFNWLKEANILIFYIFSAVIFIIAWNLNTISIFIAFPILVILFLGIGYINVFNNAEREIIFSFKFGFLNSNK